MSTKPEDIKYEQPYFDLKSLRIQLMKTTFEHLTKDPGDTISSDNKVIFFTSFGMVYSDPQEVTMTEVAEAVTDGFVRVTNEQIEKWTSENPELPILNSGAFVRIKSAVIRPYGSAGTHKVADLILFTETIQAMAFGNPTIN